MSEYDWLINANLNLVTPKNNKEGNSMTNINKIKMEVEEVVSKYYSNVKSEITALESNGITKFDISVGGNNKEIENNKRIDAEYIFKYDIEYKMKYGGYRKTKGFTIAKDNDSAIEKIKGYYRLHTDDINSIHIIATKSSVYELQ